MILARRWEWLVDIHIGEIKAAILWLRLGMLVGAEAGRRALTISDNLATVCSLVKGRAHDYVLNAECRKRAAYEAVTDVALCPAWEGTCLLYTSDAADE